MSGRRSRVARRRAVGHGLRIGPSEHAPGSRPQASVRAQLVPCRARAVRCSRWPLGAWRDEGVGAERRPRQWWEWMPHLSARPPAWGRGAPRRRRAWENLGRTDAWHCCANKSDPSKISQTLLPPGSPSLTYSAGSLSAVGRLPPRARRSVARRSLPVASVSTSRAPAPPRALPAVGGYPAKRLCRNRAPRRPSWPRRGGGVTLRGDFARTSAHHPTA